MLNNWGELHCLMCGTDPGQSAPPSPRDRAEVESRGPSGRRLSVPRPKGFKL